MIELKFRYAVSNAAWVAVALWCLVLLYSATSVTHADYVQRALGGGPQTLIEFESPVEVEHDY